MSRSKNTTSPKYSEENRRKLGIWFGMWARAKETAKKFNKSARTKAKRELSQGVEPEPYRPRNSAKWWN